MDDRALAGKTIQEVVRHCEPTTDLERYLIRAVDDGELVFGFQECEECLGMELTMDSLSDSCNGTWHIMNDLVNSFEDDDDDFDKKFKAGSFDILQLTRDVA